MQSYRSLINTLHLRYSTRAKNKEHKQQFVSQHRSLLESLLVGRLLPEAQEIVRPCSDAVQIEQMRLLEGKRRRGFH